MQDREIQHYHIQGYGTFFEEALPSIKSTLDKKLGDKEESVYNNNIWTLTRQY